MFFPLQQRAQAQSTPRGWKIIQKDDPSRTVWICTKKMYLKRPCGFCTRTQKRRSSFFLFIEPAFQKQISMNPRRARRHRFENARAHLLVERIERIYWENFFRISYFEKEIYSLPSFLLFHFSIFQKNLSPRGKKLQYQGSNNNNGCAYAPWSATGLRLIE